MKNLMNNTITNIWNVVGTIEGTVEPDRLVLVGNHRDAWVFGAVDPSSGTAALIEMAKAFGKMLADGWKPRRTIKLLSWDAEEYGLVGSSEYAEQHAAVLTTQAVAYLNVDIAVQGTPLLEVRASPTMNQVLRKVSKLVSSPSATTFKGQALPTVYDMWRAADNFPADREPRSQPLGSGSDFTPFFQHLGITAMDLSIEGEKDGYDGVYHSIYDSFYWMEHFGDPTFEYHAALTKVWGLLTRELAGSYIRDWVQFVVVLC
jgi:N-acetylated-alpha-linked acidic dipeptidase